MYVYIISLVLNLAKIHLSSPPPKYFIIPVRGMEI